WSVAGIAWNDFSAASSSAFAGAADGIAGAFTGFVGLLVVLGCDCSAGVCACEVTGNSAAAAPSNRSSVAFCSFRFIYDLPGWEFTHPAGLMSIIHSSRMARDH